MHDPCFERLSAHCVRNRPAAQGLARPMTCSPEPGWAGMHVIAVPAYPYGNLMESLLIPTLVVALAEIGDKTQLLALLLAARFRRPWPIIWGMVTATLLNHFAAGAVGSWLADLLSPATLRALLAVSFALVAIWTLIPDKLDEKPDSYLSRFGPFLTTLVAFFLAEMGDKTQIATVMLAAQYPHFILVVIGTTLGMLLANVPVVLAGNLAAERLPMTLIRRLAASAFAALAIYALYKSLALYGVF